MLNKKSIPEPVSSQLNLPDNVSGVRITREYIEALIVALVLAFFLKAFVAEAYLIPTGSMASTLMGRHKDVYCEMCNYQFQINASEESDDQSPISYVDFAGNPIPPPRVVGGTCPICRHTMYIGSDNIEHKNFDSFNGDRIFVNKSQFDFKSPQRWHVTVFRYPAKPQINYIKRLIGLENETVRIEHGDIFVKRSGETDFEIQRKPLPQLLAMLRIVDDNDYVSSVLHDIGWQDKWNNISPGNWKRTADFKSFYISNDNTNSDNSNVQSNVQSNLSNEINNKNNSEHWLEFSNIVPTSDDWFALKQNRLPQDSYPSMNPQLVTDSIAYNSGIVRYPDSNGNIRLEPEISFPIMTRDGETRREHFCRQSTNGMGLNWVSDLAVSVNLNVQKTEGVFMINIVKGGIIFQCEFNLETGDATVSIPDYENLFEPVTAKTKINSKGNYKIMFCNIDEEMRLIVNDKEINFNMKNRYDKICTSNTPLNRNRQPTKKDLKPIRIGAKDTSIKIENIKVWRDMYYIACDDMNRSHCDLLDSPLNYVRNAYTVEEIELAINRFFANPEYWKTLGQTRAVEFQMEKNQFLMLGDNSAKSKDSRLWTEDHIPHYVERKMLIGEAIFVYWPHGLRLFGTRLAIVPNFKKIRRIY